MTISSASSVFLPTNKNSGKATVNPFEPSPKTFMPTNQKEKVPTKTGEAKETPSPAQQEPNNNLKNQQSVFLPVGGQDLLAPKPSAEDLTRSTVKFKGQEVPVQSVQAVKNGNDENKKPSLLEVPNKLNLLLANTKTNKDKPARLK